MDVHDVSGTPEYAQFMEMQFKNLLEAQKRKGRRPQSASRDELDMKYMFGRMMRGDQTASNHNMRTTFIPPAYLPCTVPLANLTKIMIKDMRLETHHRGSYVLLKAIVPADRISGVFSIVEDEEGSALTISLYYQGKDRAVEGILPQTTVFIVKEPYLKVMADGNCGIRVDQVTDVFFLGVENPLMPAAWRQMSRNVRGTADSLKAKGNEHFHEGKYFAASDRYVLMRTSFWIIADLRDVLIATPKPSIVIPLKSNSAR